MRYDAGKLDKIITVEGKIRTRTESGSFNDTLDVKYKQIKANVSMTRGNESIISDSITPIHYSLFTIREHYDITESDIIIYKKFKYDVVSVIPSPKYDGILLVYANKTID